MKIAQILTQRRHVQHPAFHLVYEWEDVLAESLGCPIVDDVSVDDLSYRIGRKFFPFVERFVKTDIPSFAYAMTPMWSWGNNKSSIIPCIIDYFLRERSQIRWFFKRHAKNHVVLISSREAYEFLRERGCPENVRHWALSIADRWIRCEWNDERIYDAVILGRENPVLKSYAERYAGEHPSFSFVASEIRDGRRVYVESKSGNVLHAETREDYMRLMRMSRSGLYATPGLDGASRDANGFNQVTPRFLEYLSSGCHVIAKYARNADTEFYEMEKMSMRVDSYDQFSRAMDYARNNPIDVADRKRYLTKHITSRRAVELKQILASL